MDKHQNKKYHIIMNHMLEHVKTHIKALEKNKIDIGLAEIYIEIANDSNMKDMMILCKKDLELKEKEYQELMEELQHRIAIIYMMNKTCKKEKV